MVEKQVKDAYQKFKKKIFSGIDSDAFFTYFTKYIKSGSRTVAQHNIEKNKYIDELWVNEIMDTIPHMQRIINNPRSYMKSMETITPIELARKISSNSVKHLASHTQFISQVDKDGIRPSKIMTTYNEQSYDIYENRFIMTLLRNMERFVDIRYYMLGGKVGNEFTSEFEFSGKFAQSDEQTTYNFSMKIEQGPKYMGADDDAGDLFAKLEQIRMYIQGFNASEFVRSMSSVALVRPPINKTNMLMKQPDYHRCFQLWEFINGYTKAGYKIDVVDSNPVPRQEFLDETEVVMLLNYAVMKMNMAEFQETRKAEFANVRTYEPNIVQKYDTVLKDAQDIEDYKTLVAALKEGKSPRIRQMVMEAIERALDKEDSKRQEEADETKNRNVSVLDAIKRAVNIEERRKVEADKQIKDSIREAEVAMALQKVSRTLDPEYDPEEDLVSFFSDDTLAALKNRSGRSAPGADEPAAPDMFAARERGGYTDEEEEYSPISDYDDQDFDDMDDLSLIRHLLEDKKPQDGEKK